MNYYQFAPFASYNFIESTSMVDTTSKVIKLTRKWKPKRIKRIYTSTPKKDLIVIDNTIIGHPQTIRALKQKIVSEQFKTSFSMGIYS